MTHAIAKLPRWAALVAAAACGLLVGPLATSAKADSSTGKYYSIHNSGQHGVGRVLTHAPGGSGSAVTLETYTGSNRQHWRWEPADGDGMRLVNRQTKLCLHIDFATGPLRARDCAEVSEQRWLWTYSPLGQSRLGHVQSNTVVTAIGTFETATRPAAGFEDVNQAFQQTFRGQD